MSPQTRQARALLARPRSKALAGVLAATALVAASSSAPVWAGESNGGVDVVNTETVQVYTDADGHVKSKRLYEQLALSGHGKVRLENPVSKNGLRNLDGFGGFDVKNGVEYVNATVDGEKALRSLNTYKGDLPLNISIAYTLDGKKVSADDVVGKSGHLQVRFSVENVSSKEQEISFPDGKGGTVTKTVEVPIPIVGSLGLVAPSNFRNVTSGEANLAGDGKGGTQMSFTMTLFPPIGSTKADFGYEADITDGVVPRVSVSALPVDPLASPTFKSAANSYQGGADTGTELTAGATEIDGNLLKLRDGAADLLAGLLKLHDGADELSAGLNDTAVPGAEKLAGGAKQLDDGLGQLDDGASQLADGSGDLDAGAKKLRKGAGQLSSGLGQAKSGASDLKKGTSQIASGQKSLADGLQQLKSGVEGLPASVQEQVDKDPAYNALTGALQSVIGGIGTSSDTSKTTILGALNNMKWGLRHPAAACSVDAARCGVLDAVEAVRDGINAQLDAAGGLPAALAAARTSAGCATDQVCAGNLDAIIPTLSALPDQLKTARDTLNLAIQGGGQIVTGIGDLQSSLSKGDPANCAADPTSCGAKQALQAVLGGIPQLVSALSQSVSQTLLANIGTGAKGCDPTKTLLCAADTLAAGSSTLDDGAGTLLGGMKDLSTGGKQLADGTGDLADGTRDLRSGANKLADGAGDAADGSGQLADGANDLADGLGDAADGSSRIADGLGEAAEGAPQIVDGTGRLSAEGTSKLVEAGTSTAQSYGEMVAVIKAGGERAQTESMVYGAPKDAIGLAAYSYVIEGADGSGGRNFNRALLAGGLLVIAGGVTLLRRRFL
jgi:putative membrane protein